MTEPIPGINGSLRAIAITAVALLLAAGGAGYCAGRSSSDTSALEAQVKQSKDSIKVLEHARARYIGEAAAAHSAVEEARADAHRAVAAAETLVTQAERHRTFRVRVIDSTHIGTTSSDSQHVEQVSEVPVDVTVQLQLDSMALQAQDLALAKLARENNVLQLENLKLWQAVAADSAEIHQKDVIIADLTKAKSPPRCGAKCGAVITVGTLTVLEIARRALAAFLGSH